MYIKDVKSSNGTFLNGRRLSNENEESIPMEIKTNDQIEFGIDILHEDGSSMCARGRFHYGMRTKTRYHQ